jgi:hypothetical protein
MIEQAAAEAGEPQKPVEGADAGPAEEYLENRKLQRIRSAHARASGLADSARVTLNFSSSEEAEHLARQALRAAVETYWFAEGTALASAEHEYLHEIGRWTRETFGCQLDREGAKYSTSCPVMLADKRVGFSVGVVARVVCSICGENLSECSHRRSRLYWVRGGPTEFGPCRVCRKRKCAHKPDQLYKAPVIGVMKDCVLEEASVVDVPADPLARQTKLDITHANLRELLGAAFTPGVPVNCDHCLEPYHGLPDSLDIAGLSHEDPTATS